MFAATSPLLDALGGGYLKDNDVPPLDTPRPMNFTDQEVSSDVVPHAVDPESARRVWTLSECLITFRG